MFGLYLSTYLVVVIGLDRWEAISRPLRRTQSGKGRAKIWILTAWILSAVFSVPQVSYPFFYYINRAGRKRLRVSGMKEPEVRSANLLAPLCKRIHPSTGTANYVSDVYSSSSSAFPKAHSSRNFGSASLTASTRQNGKSNSTPSSVSYSCSSFPWPSSSWRIRWLSLNWDVSTLL